MLSYIGGKNRQGCWLRDYVPTDTKTYVEVFGGMMWVFLKMDLKKYKDFVFKGNTLNKLKKYV